MRLWRFTFWLMIVALRCADAHAQPPDPRGSQSVYLLDAQFQVPGPSPLRGLRSVHLLEEELSLPDADICGIDNQTVERAVSSPLAKSGLKLAGEDVGPNLYVHVITLYAKEDSTCTSFANLEVWVTQSVSIEDTLNEAFVKVILWHQHGVLIVNPKKRHRDALRSELERMAKKLVVDWTAAQR